MQQQKLFLAEPQLAGKIEDFRFAHRYSSEAAALRDMVRAGLDALKAGADQKKEAELRAA